MCDDAQRNVQTFSWGASRGRGRRMVQQHVCVRHPWHWQCLRVSVCVRVPVYTTPVFHSSDECRAWVLRAHRAQSIV